MISADTKARHKIWNCASSSHISFFTTWYLKIHLLSKRYPRSFTTKTPYASHLRYTPSLSQSARCLYPSTTTWHKWHSAPHHKYHKLRTYTIPLKSEYFVENFIFKVPNKIFGIYRDSVGWQLAIFRNLYSFFKVIMFHAHTKLVASSCFQRFRKYTFWEQLSIWIIRVSRIYSSVDIMKHFRTR